MVTGDPARTPSFVMFGNTDFWMTGGDPNCATACTVQDSAEAWNHGDLAPEIDTTWLGLAGPGVRNTGIDIATWSDHVDIEPTIMALTGLHSDYIPDGRVLAEALTGPAEPSALQKLNELYNQLESSVGAFATDTLAASTAALGSNTAGDVEYNAVERQLIRLGTARDALVLQIRAALYAYSTGSLQPSADKAASLATQADQLLAQAAHLPGA